MNNDPSTVATPRKKTMSEIALTVLNNYLEQFNPITPTQVSLIQQQIRFQKAKSPSS